MWGLSNRVLALWFVAISAAADGVPTFDDFRAADVFNGRHAAPVISSSFQRQYRTKIRIASKLTPNFAGRYRIAEWGCGTSCVSIAVINLETGIVYDPPFRVLAYAVRRKYEGGEEELEYRPNSRLLIARGCPDTRECGTYYYVWRGAGFEQLRFAPAGPVIR